MARNEAGRADVAMTIIYFPTPALLREWFERNHTTATELWVGFRKKDSGVASITWPESVDAALCFGWIDGIRKSVDATSYQIRFTPRKATSIWSNVNIRRAQELAELGMVRPAGLKALAARRENRSGIYSYEQRSAELPEIYAKVFRGNRSAWKFFQAQPPGYRKQIIWWIVSAKRETTRFARLEKLIAASAGRQRL
jgi:uncharacterized protein YdeI (YjbR/CyaY-like superfamily)